MSRPGVLIYFDLLSSCDMLSDEQAGKWIKAVHRYAAAPNPTPPDFSHDLVLAMFWSFTQPQLDTDAKKYNEKVEKSRYAVYCREAEKNGVSKQTFEEWQKSSSHIGQYQVLSDDIQLQSNNNYNNNPITKTIPITNTGTETKGGMGEKEGELPDINEILLRMTHSVKEPDFLRHFPDY